MTASLNAEGAERKRAAELVGGRRELHENQISEAVIGAAIEVHRILGPGLLESVYEDALCHELHLRGLAFTRQKPVPVVYKSVRLGTDLRLDLLIEDKVIVELKAIEEIRAIDRLKLKTYLKLSDLHLGLLINFNVERLVDGVARVVYRLREDPPTL